MTTAMRLNLVADSLNELKLPCHVHAVREAASEIEALTKEVSRLRAIQGITTVNEIIDERDSIRTENEQLRETLASQREAFEIGLKWKRNSALEEWFPITAEELISLRARVAELEKEHERLDWLIATCVDDDSSITQNNGEVCLMAASRFKAKDIRHAIDDAMSEKK